MHLQRKLSAPVDAGSLAAFRVAIGAVGLLSAVRIGANGWIDSLYSGPSHRFTYLGFGWVPQPSHAVMVGIVVALGAASLALAIGWRTRVAAGAVLVTLTWIELIDATTYLNHYWFLTLVAALAVVAPLGRAHSLDARRSGGPTDVALGWVWLLRFQVGVVYAFAGLAKLQADWLVRAQPLRLWLPARVDLPMVGWALDAPATARVLAIAGALFDCSVVPFLLWRRTRLAAWLVLVVFHVATWLLFPIGVFPWLMIGAATVFFDPAWPRTLLTRIAPRSVTPPDRLPALGHHRSGGRRRVMVAAAVVWVVVQVALPLRHLLYPGDHRWTGQGYRFAWNVLLTERAGSVTFLVRDPRDGTVWVADPADLYTPTQLRVMASEPDLVHQAARAIAAAERAEGREVEVRVDAWVSLDGRPPARLIDPTVDLSARSRDPWSDDWILPAP